MQVRAVWIAAAVIAAGCGGSDEGGSARNSSNIGAGGATAGTTGAVAGTGGAPTVPAGSGQLARCSRDEDCGAGLECYTFGRYCSMACATDSDCAPMGSAFTCYVPMGGGMMGGGGMTGSGGMTGAPAPGGGASGTCRVECTGPSDTSCPSGLMCIDVGGGFGGMMTMPTYRCGYPRMTGGGGAGTSGGGGTGGMSSGGAGGA